MRDEERKRIEDVWTRFVARESLGLEDRALLTTALERNEVLRRRMVQDLQLDGALRAAGDVERGQENVVAVVKALVTAASRTEEVVAAVRKQLEEKVAARGGVWTGAMVSSRRARASAFAVAALVACGAAAVVLLRPRADSLPEASAPQAQAGREDSSPVVGRGPRARATASSRATQAATPRARETIARLEPVEGAVYRQGPDGTQRASAALDLAPGDVVWTSGASSRARLVGPGEGRIELGGDAVAGLAAEGGGPRLFLAHGRASATVPATGRSAPLTLGSPHAMVTASGTVSLEVAAAVTRVEVKDGRARVSALGVQRGVDIEPGQFAQVSADDLQPPRPQVVAREALLLTGPDDTKEEVPPEGLRGSEQRLKARLERLGFQVSVVDAIGLTPERARAAALLVLSSSVSSNNLAAWFSELPVPMIVLESTGFEHLGLTGSRWRKDIGPTQGGLTEVAIENPSHPLAAGLSGTVRVLSGPTGLRWAAPPPGANLIATYPGGPGQSALMFSYERGAATAAGTAPARRVGLFLGNGRVIRLLTEQGWRLFDAAALWCASNGS
jgi:hypothetical protein